MNSEVESMVLDMVRDKKFREAIMAQMEEKIDTSALQAERNGLREQLRQAEGSKKKLIEQMDKLDTTDRHYDRKFQDMQDRLDIIYDRITELEESIVRVNHKINSANGEHLTAENLCEVLLDFDIMYDKMTDAEKKQFFQSFVKKIEIEANPASGGRLLKHIEFLFPVSIDSDDDQNLLFTEPNVETVVALERRATD